MSACLRALRCNRELGRALQNGLLTVARLDSDGRVSVRRRISSRFQTKHWRIERRGRTHRVEVFAQECDLAA